MKIASTLTSRNIERLFALRNIAILGQSCVVAAVHFWLHIKLPLFEMGTAILFLVLLNFFTRLRLKLSYPVTELEFFIQLLFDVSELSALLYFSGGSTNPFVSLYLLPLIIAASALPSRYTWPMAAITISCYTTLMRWYQPLPHNHAEMDFNLHVLAMWVTFVLSTLLISWFVVRMNATLKERDLLLAKAREDALRNEKIVAMGTLAAGAAHELGTPLSTMAVVANELKNDSAGETAEALALICAQIENCKKILTRLLASAGEARSEEGGLETASHFLAGTLEKWQLMRPAALFSCHEASGGEIEILASETLSQALLNLLNNAADASSAAVEIELGESGSGIAIEIRDRGPGLTPEVAARAGEAFFSTKPSGQGFGVGLFLANASIERLGGRVAIYNREGGGATTRVSLPSGKGRT